MNYLRTIGFKRTDGLPDDLPFTLPAIESLDEITFSVPVTFLVGGNGSGKSNVLEAMDEPETPLSAIHQLSLLSLLKARITEGCQFIIATHSPILMALRGAEILSFDSHPVKPSPAKMSNTLRLRKSSSMMQKGICGTYSRQLSGFSISG
jgi:predicted ATPase|tara:strand:- start:868 stop:1317 length:450 start_codon:yes stop_codon:yes gene_type:complete